MWIDSIGWIGMLVLLVAFFMASTQRMNDKKYLYHLLNFLGSLGVFAYAFSKGAVAAAAVDGAWALLALVGIGKVFDNSRRRHALE